MSKKNVKLQRPYGKKTNRQTRAKFLNAKYALERHEDYQKMNERFRAGDLELVTQVTQLTEFVKQAVKEGTVEEDVYLLTLENIKTGNPFRKPIW